MPLLSLLLDYIAGAPPRYLKSLPVRGLTAHHLVTSPSMRIALSLETGAVIMCKKEGYLQRCDGHRKCLASRRSNAGKVLLGKDSAFSVLKQPK